MARRSTKQRRAARFRNVVAKCAARAYGALVLGMVHVEENRLSLSRLRGQGWKLHMMFDGFVLGDPWFPLAWTGTLVCRHTGYMARIVMEDA